MDISSDSTLIATGSADRNVKIWGMDFGDCHKSIFAHDDSIMSLQFVPRTHYFFTCGKDGKVKEWDGDSFNKIITLQVSSKKLLSKRNQAYCNGFEPKSRTATKSKSSRGPVTTV